MKGFILALGLSTGLLTVTGQANAQYFPQQPPPGWSGNPHSQHSHHSHHGYGHHRQAPVGVYQYHSDPWGGHMHFIPVRPACETRFQPYGLVPVAPVPAAVPFGAVAPSYGFNRYPSYGMPNRPGLTIGFTYVK